MGRYYLDCEFNGLGGDLISLALVRHDAEFRYYVFSDFGLPVDWVAKNVLPRIWAMPFVAGRRLWLRPDAARDIGAFLAGDPDPVIICDWPDDIAYFTKLLITGPGEVVQTEGLKFEYRRVEPYPTTLPGAVQHNALWDALALRHLLEEA